MVSKSVAEDMVQQRRPISFPSCQSEGERGLSSFPDAQVPADEKARGSPFPMEHEEKISSDVGDGTSHLDSGNERQPYLETKSLCHLEQNGSLALRSVAQEDQASEEADILAKENFTFLEVTRTWGMSDMVTRLVRHFLHFHLDMDLMYAEQCHPAFHG